MVGIDGSRGRYARNAIIQGSAAELFKAWAATVRHAVRPLGGQIVLCLHDELLVHVPEREAQATVAAVESALTSAARTWGGRLIRFGAAPPELGEGAEPDALGGAGGAGGSGGSPESTAGTDQVRFIADTSVVRRWSEAKA